MNGLTVSLVGRNSYEYYWDSVTLWVSPLRQSHVPYNRNVIDNDLGVALMPLLLLIEECPEQLPFREVVDRPSLTFQDDT